MPLRKFVFSLVVVSAALFMSSCFSAPKPGKIVFDPDLPPERASEVLFSANIFVQEYNGIGVKGAWYPENKRRRNTVTLPPGQTTIIFNYSLAIDRGNVIYHVNLEDIELRFDFEVGKFYSVGAYIENTGFLGLGKTKFGVAVWDYDIVSDRRGAKKENALRSWEMGEV